MDVCLRLNSWQPTDWNISNHEPKLDVVGEGYRHALLNCTSQIMLPEQPADISFIQESVAAVLGAVTKIPYRMIQLVSMPLFITGTDTLSSHLRHYILLILDIIKSIAGFSNHLPNQSLQRVWKAAEISQRLIEYLSDFVCKFP
jgi:hypothetical protein